MDWSRTNMGECVDRLGKRVEALANATGLYVTEDNVPIRRLFISNLAGRTTYTALRDLFSNFGEVENCYIQWKSNKNNIAFVTYKNVEDALDAIMAASDDGGLILHGRILRVMVAHSWNQPDSVEKQSFALKIKNNDMNNSTSIVELTEANLNDSPILMLDDDCLTEIFLHLPIADRIRSERVCKRWRNVSKLSWRAVKSLDLEKSTWGLTSKCRVQIINANTLRKVLVHCGRYLTNLDLSQTHHSLESNTLSVVTKFCPNLQYINIKSFELSPSGIQSLIYNCLHINKFIMKCLTGPCEKELAILFQYNKKLKYLGIYGEGHITGRCLLHLPADIIEEIHLDSCFSLLSNYFACSLKKFTKLQSLTLSSCVCITDPALKAIGETKTIINLELSKSHPMISANAMNHLANLDNLQQLCLSENLAVTDNFLINISNNCMQLKILDISNCIAVTDKGIASLSALVNLEVLKLNMTYDVTDKELGNLRCLKILECCNCKYINDCGVIKLIEVAKNLTILDLSGCSITDNTINAAIKITSQRDNNIVLKMIVSGIESNSIEISPLLFIVNVDSSLSDDNNYMQ